MENMRLMLVLLIIEGLAVGQSTDGQSTKSVGENVLLPCLCPSKPDSLVWQIGKRVVSVHSQNKDDINSIDKMFINRTQLFLHMDKKNCSMLLLNVSLEDAGVYTCHALDDVQDTTSSRNSLDVNLTVFENKSPKENPQTGEQNTTLSSVHIAIPVLILIVMLAAGLILFLLLRRHRQNQQNIIYMPAEPMKNIV
ncbi:uncharacterized protein [Paramisgurnus dabryanus]|uniref:uncharacterized protein isoform X1 n=1 Tax=Paramisgurnus dabryanus TaxID=90735 RepID=UPI0031F4319C